MCKLKTKIEQLNFNHRNIVPLTPCPVKNIPTKISNFLIPRYNLEKCKAKQSINLIKLQKVYQDTKPLIDPTMSH